MKSLVLACAVLCLASEAKAVDQFFINGPFGQSTHGYSFRAGNATFYHIAPTYPVYNPYLYPVYSVPVYYRPCAPVYQPAYVPTWNPGYRW